MQGSVARRGTRNLEVLDSTKVLERVVILRLSFFSDQIYFPDYIILQSTDQNMLGRVVDYNSN